MTLSSLGVISPGPGFPLAARTAICASSAAVSVAPGMAASGASLLFPAVRIWRGAGRPLAISGAPEKAPTRPIRNALTGIGTMSSNPGPAVQYGVTSQRSSLPHHQS